MHTPVILFVLMIFFIAEPLDGATKNIKFSETKNRQLTETIVLSRKHGLFIPTIYKFNSNKALTNQSDQLTALMKIEIRDANQSTPTNPIDKGQFIENLIYANLRIQQLIEEYNKLRDDKESFQKDFLGIKDREEIKQTVTALKVSNFEKLNLEINLLKRQFQNASKIENTISILENNNHNVDENVLTSAQNYKTTFKTFSPKDFNKDYRTHMAPVLETSASNDKSDVEDDDKKQRKSTITEDMPWAIRFLASSVTYFTKNKIECLVYLVIFVFFISVLAGGRK